MKVDIQGLLAEGARRVWRYQRVVWWLFFVNVLLAIFGVRPGAEQFGAVLDHSQHAQSLTRAFDVFAFIEVVSRPEIQIGSVNSSAFGFALIFFFFSLFLTGGILEAYRAGRKLRTPEFFHACGAFFWRWVRLTSCLVLFLLPVMILGSILYGWSDKLSDTASRETLGFWVLLSGALLLLAAVMALRLWFDMAQVRTVAQGELAIRKSLAQALRVTRQNFGPLFWMYFRTSFVAWFVLAIALLIWSRIPSYFSGWSALLLEAVILVWFVVRLWQRSIETVWYERWQVSQAAQPTPPSSLASEVRPLPAAAPFAG